MTGLAIREGGIYVDATYGGGGHSRELLRRLRGGTVIALDQDESVQVSDCNDDRLKLLHYNFRHLKRVLSYLRISQVDGILADLGLSSLQLADEQRGFSYRSQGLLDLRMSRQAPQTAAALLASWPEAELQKLFSSYGEVRNARTLARRLVQHRRQRPLRTVQDLIEAIKGCVRGNPNRYLAQVFQALRIAVNDELESLKEFLLQCKDVLRSGGRLVVISYHSLEDRLVKRFMRTGSVDEVQSGQKHTTESPFHLITKKVIVPSAEEVAVNPRARSARLRIAEKR